MDRRQAPTATGAPPGGGFSAVSTSTTASSGAITTDTSTSSSLSVSTTISSSVTAPPNGQAGSLAPSTPVQTSQFSQGSPVSNGGIVGIAIGAAAVGAIFATIFVCLFMRRRSKPRRKRSYSNYEKSNKSGKELLSVTTTEYENSSVSRKDAWMKHLPQPIDDNSLRMAIQTIFHSIELHVENFYTDGASLSHLTETLQTQLKAYDSGKLPSPVSVMLLQGGHNTTVIKHCLTYFIISSITAENTSHQSFLPPECTSLITAMTRDVNKDDKPSLREALSQHRRLTAYLRPDTTENPAHDPTYAHNRDNTIFAAANAFTSTFAPWASPSQSINIRVQNLIEIMRSAAETGILIYSQSTNFESQWDVSPPPASSQQAKHRGGTVITTPAWLKVSDEWAKPLARPQIMVAACFADK